MNYLSDDDDDDDSDQIRQPAVVCQECTVADDVPSRAEDCTFPVVV